MNYLSQNLHAPRVLCALSGGVDSAVAAALLLKAGYEVTGAFIKCFTPDSSPIRGGQVGSIDASCWVDERRDALRVCAKLGIKLLTFDFEKEYRRFVVDYLFREYKAGRTPNPDVICNQRVKIPLLLREAKKMGFDFVATGHYARLTPVRREFPISNFQFPISNTNFQFPISNFDYQFSIKLLEATDKNKDQTYFLHQLKQAHLKKLIFPLASINKEEVRRLARQWRLSVADKEESMGICFIGEVPMKEFLKKRIKSRPGNIVTADGKVIGRHEGLAFYTIGQRVGTRGFSPYKGELEGVRGPLYVLDKRKQTDELVVGHEDNPLLYKKECLVRKVNWLAGQPPKFPLKCEVRLRHRQPLQECRIFPVSGGIKVNFKIPQRAVTPGQFAVFYLKGECLGGGVIASDTSLRAKRSNPVVN